MTIKSKECVVSFSCRKKPTDREHEKIRERINDPYTLTGIDRLRAFHQTVPAGGARNVSWRHRRRLSCGHR